MKSVILLFCILPLTGLAQEMKIGFVNTARVLKEAPQAEAARKRLETDFSPRDQKIVAMQKELRKLEDQLATDGSSMSDTRRKKLQRKIKELRRDIKRAREEFGEDLNLRRNEELTRLQKLIYDIILALAKEEKFDLILSENVLYASTAVDVTDQVLERLREEYKRNPGGEPGATPN
ncbi:MAG TPA: OmpH family outer membrane protein [Gammaproteobacteria bacterium]|nr:OmpH family outer membrane protein [Gammaproteobacteria bacterium]